MNLPALPNLSDLSSMFRGRNSIAVSRPRDYGKVVRRCVFAAELVLISLLLLWIVGMLL